MALMMMAVATHVARDALRVRIEMTKYTTQSSKNVFNENVLAEHFLSATLRRVNCHRATDHP
jgi:hypothetical protein